MSFLPKKNLILHDYFENFGGGERLITNLYNSKKFDLIYGFDENNLIKKLNIHKKSQGLISPTIPKILKKFLIKKKFENLILNKKYCNYFISGNYSIFLNKQNSGKKIFYCHSLPKLFFFYNRFYNNKNLLKKIIHFFYKNKFKMQFLDRLKEVDLIICNSKYTQNNLKKFTNLKSVVVYPPIEIDKFTWISQKKYFISNSRHENGKNIEKIIKVFKKLNHLKIYLTSRGSKTNYLKRLAKNSKNIIFKDLLNEKNYSKLLGNCCATINISNSEDFGMAAVEGLAAGKPSITINEGGYLETIKNNYNGYILNKLNIEDELSNYLSKVDFKKLYLMKKNCIKSARKYSAKNFIKKILRIIN
jgi:glycosyltransferase involved in cell wall biosynthesis